MSDLPITQDDIKKVADELHKLAERPDISLEHKLELTHAADDMQKHADQQMIDRARDNAKEAEQQLRSVLAALPEGHPARAQVQNALNNVQSLTINTKDHAGQAADVTANAKAVGTNAEAQHMQQTLTDGALAVVGLAGALAGAAQALPLSAALGAAYNQNIENIHHALGDNPHLSQIVSRMAEQFKQAAQLAGSDNLAMQTTPGQQLAPVVAQYNPGTALPNITVPGRGQGAAFPS